jgi:predicted RNA methylase
MLITSQIIDFITISLIIFAVFMLWIFWSDVLGAGFEPTSRKIVKNMLEMARVEAGDVVYDLGSGDGRIVIEAARSFNAGAVGIEADPLRFLWSKVKVLLLGLQKQVDIRWGNFFREDISEATVVTLFLSRKANQNLKSKLKVELQPGTRVVTYYWKFNGWKPVQEDMKNHIYLYVVGQTTREYHLKGENTFN